MSILNIQEAKREGARLVIGIDALSGDGKTLSALYVAWGLTGGDASKIGFLDTENKRGALYADKLVDKNGKIHRFKIASLDAPFTPERYSMAIKEFQAAGIEVLVIDSVSHEWEGSGGCSEIAEFDNSGSVRKFPAWNIAKSRHKKFMNTLLNSDVHIIACIRSREKMRLEKDPSTGKTIYISEGIQPIQEKNFMFELTASLQLAANGKHRFVKKCPTELVAVFGEPGEWAEGYLTPQHGTALRQWVAGVDPDDAKREKARNHMRTEVENGTSAVLKVFENFTDDIHKLFDHKIPNDILESAKAYDEMQKQPVDDINSDLDGE